MEKFDWQWQLVGNETAAEKAIADRMIQEAKQFLCAMIEGKEPRWLVYLGNPGCGKTHLSERLKAFLKDRARTLYDATERPRRDPGMSDYRTCYSYAQEGAIMAKWGVMIGAARERDYSRLKLAASDWVKIIDDLGTESFAEDQSRTPRATAFVCQQMGRLLDDRARKWTVLSANFSRSQFAEQFDSRIASRLMRHGNVIVDCSGLRDFNLRMETAKKQVA